MASMHNTGHMSSKILSSVVQMIDVSVSRATWKGEEIGQIAQLREIFSEASSAAQKAEQELAEKIAQERQTQNTLEIAKEQQEKVKEEMKEKKSK